MKTATSFLATVTEECNAAAMFRALCSLHEPNWTAWERAEYRRSILDGNGPEVLEDLGYMLGQDAAWAVRKQLPDHVDFNSFNELWSRAIPAHVIVSGSDKFLEKVIGFATLMPIFHKEEYKERENEQA